MNIGDFVKFKGHNPEYWDIAPGKTYVVQDTKYKGYQPFILLRNKHGKLRRYYEHLFEEVKLPLDVEDDPFFSDPTVRELKDMWLKSDDQKSRDAYTALEQLSERWKSSLEISKGSTVRFIRGKESGRFGNRTFRVLSEPKHSGMFHACVRLEGLYGFYDVKSLQVIGNEKDGDAN